jgi:hypothetical protein
MRRISANEFTFFKSKTGKLANLAAPILLASFILLGFLCLSFARADEDAVSNPGAASIPTTALPNGVLKGRVLERGTKKPLNDVNVYLLPSKDKVVTGLKGDFEFSNVPPGKYQVVINLTNYVKHEEGGEIAAGEVLNGTVYLEKVNYNAFETTVTAKAEKRDDTTRSFRREQFLTLPGADGDPVKAVQNLPGVARPPGGSANVIIQGSEPKDTNYLLDGQKVPLIFHFGGLTSVIMPEAVEQVDYLSAGYGVEYGRAMGGIVGLQTRDPKTDRTQGFAFIDTEKSGALIEGPIDDKSSFLITGRYSYIGYVLKAAVKGNDSFDLTVAPSFADLAGIYDLKASAKDHVRVLVIGSKDELKFLLKEPIGNDPQIRGDFSDETSFYRIIPQLTHIHSDTATSRWSLGFGKDFVSVALSDYYFSLDATVVTQRAELENKISPTWTSYLGMDNSFTNSNVKVRFPFAQQNGGVSSPISSGAVVEREITGQDLLLAPYWRNVFKPTDTAWTLTPALRVDYFSSTDEVLPAPRAAVRYDIDPSLFLRFATGLYYQPPEPQETDDVAGNPDIKSPHALHFATGFEKDFRNGAADGLSLSTGLFYRVYDKLVITSSSLVTRNGQQVPEHYNNNGTGKSYGLETQLRFDFKPWSGFLSYTLSRATRAEPGQDEHLFEYDQTHNINLIAQVDLKRNWKLSTRLRYVTGNPNTPVIGAYFDADNDVYVPQRGGFYSERLDSFFQLDFRADKKFVYDTYVLWAYLDLQNVTNAKNSEGIRYSYNYSQRTTITGLPVFPTIGLRGDF